MTKDSFEKYSKSRLTVTLVDGRVIEGKISTITDDNREELQGLHAGLKEYVANDLNRLDLETDNGHVYIPGRSILFAKMEFFHPKG